MAELTILEGGAGDFGFGLGVVNHRPHLMDRPVLVRRARNTFPHLVDMTMLELSEKRRTVPIVSPTVARAAKQRGVHLTAIGTPNLSQVKDTYTPPQRGIPYYRPHLPLGLGRGV